MQIDVQDLTRIKLEPGEALYIRVAGPTPPVEMVNRIKKNLEPWFPNNLILVSGTDAVISKITPG